MSKKYSEFEQYMNPGGHLINLDDETREELILVEIMFRLYKMCNIGIKEKANAALGCIPDGIITLS